MRRYVLGDAQSEDGVINDKGLMGDIFYGHSVVGNNTYFTYTKMGGTLPAFKYEIEDFFFTRLGTGRTYRCSLRHNVCQPLRTVLTNAKNIQHIGVEIFSAIFLVSILYKHSVVADDTYYMHTKMGGAI